MKDDKQTRPGAESPLMKNDAQRNGAGEAPKKMPSLDDCKKWSRQDLNAAIYFLNVLRDRPDILDACASKLHEWATKQNGAGINHVETPDPELKEQIRMQAEDAGYAD